MPGKSNNLDTKNRGHGFPVLCSGSLYPQDGIINSTINCEAVLIQKDYVLRNSQRNPIFYFSRNQNVSRFYFFSLTGKNFCWYKKNRPYNLPASAALDILHKHSAVEVSVCFQFSLSQTSENNVNKHIHCTIIPSDVPHRIKKNRCGSTTTTLLIDPLSILGEGINRVSQNKVVFKNLQTAMNEQLHKAQLIKENISLVEVTHKIVSNLKTAIDAFDTKQIDQRILTVKKRCIENCGAKISLDTLSCWTFLSKSRARHLFKQETGITFQRYLKWIKFLCAVHYVCRFKSNLTEAAHMAGFSDSAHLTRTVKDMFGIPPSHLIKNLKLLPHPQASI